MGPLLVVEGQISPNPLSGLSPILVCLQVHLLVLDAAPQPFHEDVVHAPAPAVHAHLNALRQQHAGEGLAGELGGILKKCVNSQAVYPLSEQHGLKARERRYTAHEEGKHWE